MYRWFVNDPKSKINVFLTKVERIFLWALAVMPIAYFSGMCNPDRINGLADIVNAFLWLGLGLGMTAAVVISTLYTLQNEIESVGESVDRLRSNIDVEGIRVALELAISALENPQPDQIDFAKRIAQNNLDRLPDPPTTEPTS